MTVPVVNAIINFSTGPATAQAMIFGQSVICANKAWP